MKIIVLDKCTVTKGDLNLTAIEELGDVEYYDMLSKPEIISVLKGADAVICNKSVIDRDIIASASLKYIGLFATGYNNVDIAYAKQRGIVVCNVPGYSTASVTQLTLSLMLELACSTSRYAASVADGEWKRASQFSYFDFPINEISGKTIGIYGLGTIGLSVARAALAFNMRVIAYTRTPKHVPNIELVSENELFTRSDFLTVHCPLTDKTEKLINRETLSIMKPTAYIINTSRGGVIDEYALADALKNGVIAGAALDVLTQEPMAQNCPLWGLDNCIITPHVAWASIEARTRLIEKVAENIKAFKQGSPINVVNK